MQGLHKLHAKILWHTAITHMFTEEYNCRVQEDFSVRRSLGLNEKQYRTAYADSARLIAQEQKQQFSLSSPLRNVDTYHAAFSAGQMTQCQTDVDRRQEKKKRFNTSNN